MENHLLQGVEGLRAAGLRGYRWTTRQDAAKSRPMSHAQEQTQIRAAWLYYMEGLTQADIAKQLRLTRLRVNRILAQARENGFVSIKINSRLDDCVRLERLLVEECGLRHAVVVPTPKDRDLLAPVIGRAAAEFMSGFLEENKARGLGVGWGATLRETVRHLRSTRLPALKVSSMMGGLTHGSEINTFNIASEFAGRLGASCHYLAAPIYAATPKSRDTILAQEVFVQSFDIVRLTDLAILSVGDLTRRSLLIRYGLPSDVPVEELARRGAVGDVMGQFLDAEGRPIEHEINRRAIALPLDELRRIPTVILASGGANKAPIIAAAIRARLVSVLVCDERAAQAVHRLLRKG
jgi:DNA-binding transcriptional regulator LsrR (DeoR family)